MAVTHSLKLKYALVLIKLNFFKADIRMNKLNLYHVYNILKVHITQVGKFCSILKSRKQYIVIRKLVNMLLKDLFTNIRIGNHDLNDTFMITHTMIKIIRISS